jgi:hypothetical protein
VFARGERLRLRQAGRGISQNKNNLIAAYLGVNIQAIRGVNREKSQ